MSYQPISSGIPTWTFGDRLRKVRRSAGLTMDELAEALGVTKGTIGHYETDKSHPKDVVATAKRIQMLTGVSAKWMLGFEDETPSPGGEGLPTGPTITRGLIDFPGSYRPVQFASVA